jgi:hypothetical protein
LLLTGGRGASPSERPSELLGDVLALSVLAFSVDAVFAVGIWKPVLGRFEAGTDPGAGLPRNTIVVGLDGAVGEIPFTTEACVDLVFILLTA